MMNSMTAYGRATAVGEKRDYTVEIRSVNSRYFDCSVRLPRDLLSLEERVKSFVKKEAIGRGKVDITISFTPHPGTETNIAVDTAFVSGYLKALGQLRDGFGLRDDISVMKVASNPSVFTQATEETDPENEWGILSSALREACEIHSSMRHTEGKKIEDDLYGKLAFIGKCVDEIEERSKEDISGFREKFEARLRQILADERITPDENRILTECAVYADRIAIDEELVRLRSHFSAFREIANESEPSGKKLDFLMQEMNRETNTIGSKCNDAIIARTVVTVKNELEKIREQVQNIE